MARTPSAPPAARPTTICSPTSTCRHPLTAPTTTSVRFVSVSRSGTVYSDSSALGFNNGVQNAGETGIGGVTIQANGIDAFGNPFITTTTTDSAGRYLFNNLSPATTQIRGNPTRELPGRQRLAGNARRIAQQRSIRRHRPARRRLRHELQLRPTRAIHNFRLRACRDLVGFNDGIKQASEAGIAMF